MSTIELAWTISNYVYFIAVTMITGICFYCFVRPYMQSKKTAVCVGIVYVTVMLVLYVVPLQFDNFAAYSIGVLASFIVMYLEDRKNVEQKIFLAVTFFSLRWLNIALVNRIYCILIKVIVMKQSIAERPWLQFGIFAVISILALGIIFLLIKVSIYFLNKFFDYKKEKMTKKELLILIMPSLVGAAGYGISRSIQSIYAQDAGKDLTFVHGIYGHFSFLYYFISIISILSIVIAFQNVKARRLKAEALEKQFAYLQEKQRDEERILSIYHDMKNHLLLLQTQAGNGQEIQESFQGLREQIQEYQNYYHTGNQFLDIIIRDKAKAAQEKQTDFNAVISFEDGAFIEPLDISTIFGNALDNALEASEKLPVHQRMITVRANRVRDMLVIIVKNNETLDTSVRTGTTKNDSFVHGFGLPNIKNAVERYNGQCNIKAENERFILKILIPIP